MKTYCVRYRKDIENIDPVLEQKIIEKVCNQNVQFA